MGVSDGTKRNPNSDAYEGEEMVEATGLRQRNRLNGANGAGEEEAMTVEQVFESKPVPSWREQLTFRAFFVAFFLAVLFSVIVMKLNLTTGIIPSLNVSAGLLGFFFVRMWTVALEKWGLLKQPFTRQENTVIQTAVVAAYGLAFSGMESLKKIVYTDHHEKVSKAFFRAENWQALCGPHAQIERYAIATENALTCFPRSLEEDNAIQGRLVDLFQEQAHNVCIQVEILVAMKYLQKARLEAFATKDNYASDKLGHVDASIQKLIQCHDMLVECYYQKHY